MGVFSYIASLVQSFLFLSGVLVVSGKVEISFDRPCYSLGGEAVLTAEYKPTGSESVTALNWYFNGVYNIRSISCQKVTEKPEFPNERMDYSCTESASNRFQVSIASLETSDKGEWGISFGLSAGGPTEPQTTNLTFCAPTIDEPNDLSAGEIAGIVIGSICAVLIVGALIFLAVKYLK